MEPIDRFRLLTALAVVDARLEPSEKQVLFRYAEALGVRRDEAKAILAEFVRGGRVTRQRPPEDPDERAALFQGLVDVVVADGVVTHEERATLERLAPSFDVSVWDLREVLDQALAKRTGAPAPAAAPPPAPQDDAALTGALAAAAVSGSAAVPLSTGSPPPLPGAAGTTPPGDRPVRRKIPKTPSGPRTGEASCPSCGAAVAFKNARSVAAVCEYCDTTVVRSDRGGALEDLGKVSHVVEDASPVQLGATGEAFGTRFEVIGRLQVKHPTGFWNEWFLAFADGRTGWLGEALGQYFVTFPTNAADEERAEVPAFAELAVGQSLHLLRKRYTVAEVRTARATGTEGETPFVVTDGYELPFADLRRDDAGFATIDYSEDPPLVFVGRCVRWRELAMRGHRRFDGWA